MFNFDKLFSVFMIFVNLNFIYSKSIMTIFCSFLMTFC